MTLWNSDGGRAEISGNGLRCLAQALATHSGQDRTSDLALTIDTDAGTREAVVRARPVDGEPGLDQVAVAMGKAVEGPAPSTRWAELGVTVTDQLGVDVGNPHLVGFVDTLDGYDMATIGPALEADHPGGLNVHLVTVTDRSRLEMIIWERGAGVTMACGSGACAAAWTAVRAGLVDPDGVEVVMPGGAARVVVTDDEVVLTGPAVRIGEVRLDG
jgi:diaminopimelate epimerase